MTGSPLPRALRIASLAFTIAGESHARDPSIWDAAARPRLARDVAALRDAEKAYLQATTMDPPSAMRLVQQAARTLQDVDAAASPDPRVRFFFGRLLTRLGEDAQAVTVLRSAVSFAPRHSSVGEAYFSLAVSLARLGRTQDEVAAYDAWLQHESSPQQRAVGLSNQAEGYMASGRIDQAVRTYRRSVRLAPDNALAHWGLAVALDRDGDPAGALHEAGVALTFDPDAKQLRSPDVFFVPPHDVYWYEALGAMARVRKTNGPGFEALWWEHATLLWQRYLDAAPAEDRWRPIARLRLTLCARSMREAKARERPRRKKLRDPG